MNTNPARLAHRHPVAAAIALLCALGALAIMPAAAQQKPPAERRNIDPAARTKVGTVMARSRIEREDAERQVNEGMAGGPGGKNCSTNIGAPASQKPAVGQRYGAGGKGDQVIVVRGPVINVCK